MSSLSKTARLQISAVSLPEIPVCTGSPFLQRCWTLSCSNLPVLLSRLCRFQNQTEARPIRRRCPPDTGRQRRLFFCSFCGTRSVSASRYGSHRFPAASAVLRATSCFSFNSGTDTVRPSTWRAHSTKTWQAFSFINRLRTTSAGLSSPATRSSLRLVEQVSTSKSTIW